MKFLSIKEFFYKLNTIGFILLLVPLVGFAFLYFLGVRFPPPMPDDGAVFVAVVTVILVALAVLTIVNWVAEMKLVRHMKRPELTGRMEGYGKVTVMRMASYCACSLLSAMAFFLTGSPVFTLGFLFMVIFVSFQWPTPQRLCKALGLQGSEREMVLKNLDTIKKAPR